MRVSALVLVSFLSASFVVHADEKKLFIPVSETKAQKLIEYNSPDVEVQKYYSSRYRIVKVRTKLLTSGAESFVINPFEDVALEVIPEEIDRSDSLGSIIWRGNYKHWSRISIDSTRNNGVRNEEERKNAIGRFTKMTFYIYPWDVNKESGEVNPTVSTKAGSMGGVNKPENNEKGVGKGLRKRAFQTVKGSFNVLGKGTFAVIPLKYTPKYHLVYELDPSKRYSGMGYDEKNMSPSDKERRRNEQEFMKNLPGADENKMVVEDVE